MEYPGGLGMARRAAVAYKAAFVAGSAISIRRGYVAEPLGIRTGRTVRGDVLSGVYGAALAPPWTMIVQLYIALRLARTDRVGRRGAGVAGVPVRHVRRRVRGEPVSHRLVTRELPPADATVAVANVVLPIAMLGGALASLVDDRR